MHAIEGSGNVPAFLTKLWRLVDDPDTSGLIAWSQNGRSFIIQNQAIFSRELLPQYYKHNNMASFIRQLNMYGFHKVISADSGGLRVERDEMEFAHPHFIRGHEDQLENIKRKKQRRIPDSMDFPQIPAGRTMVVGESKAVTKLLDDVRDMKRDQETMNSKMIGLRRENESLWREYAAMRQKFTKQQQIIEKLIHFLVSMVKTPSTPLVHKRKFGHLALRGTDAAGSIPQFSSRDPVDVLESDGSPSGAQIFDVTDLGEFEAEAEGDSGAEILDQAIGTENNFTTTTTTITTPTRTAASKVTRVSPLHVPQAITELEIRSVPFDGPSPSKRKCEPGNILTTNGETYQQNISPSESQTVPNNPTDICATSVVSPEGTILIDEHIGNASFEDLLADNIEASPLSPELLDTVDPSDVTTSVKYPVPSFSPSSKGRNPSGAGSSIPVRVIPQKGKGKKITTTTATTSSLQPSQGSSMSVAVPEKTVYKQDLQNHMDEMQNSLDSLQDFFSTNNFNVDPSMLLSIFGTDNNYLPELDTLGSTSSGNEVSLYNPTLLDFSDMDEDPLTFLNSTIASSSATPTTTTTTSTTAVSASSSSSNSTVSQATPTTSVSSANPRLRKLNIKKENTMEDSLETPIISPVAPLASPTPPLSRSKRRNL